MTGILITGATGFVGRLTCRQLHSHGHDVRGAVRSETGELQIPVIAVGNIGPDTDWSAALAGCKAVIHLAAHVHVLRGQAGGEANEFNRVNVAGSENLARQAARAGVRRFVFLSSVKVNGETSAGRAFIESDPVAPQDAYGVSKVQAEEKLKAICAETGMEVVIVRPPLVYGAGVGANFLGLLQIVDAGWPMPLASVRNRRSLVHVGNLASAIEACLTRAAAANRTFLVSDDHDVSTPELVETIAAALGKNARLFPCSPVLLRTAGGLMRWGDRIARLTESLQVDITRIKTELEWRPPFSMAQGMAETVVWYRSRRK